MTIGTPLPVSARKSVVILFGTGIFVSDWLHCISPMLRF
jgi:hypothetical protein